MAAATIERIIFISAFWTFSYALHDFDVIL